MPDSAAAGRDNASQYKGRGETDPDTPPSRWVFLMDFALFRRLLKLFGRCSSTRTVRDKDQKVKENRHLYEDVVGLGSSEYKHRSRVCFKREVLNGWFQEGSTERMGANSMSSISTALS